MAEDKEPKEEKTVPAKAAKKKRKRAAKNRPGPRSRKAKARREENLKAKAGAEDSEEEDDEGEESEEEATEGAGEKGAAKKPKTKANRLAEANYDRPDRGVIFVGQLPLGFYEPQMKTYFKQFGTVTRLRLARSKKTGNTKGYGWVEFEEMEVAQVVAQTMNKYMIFGKVLSVEIVPPEKVPPALFKNWRRKWKNLSFRKRKAHREQHNDRPKVEVEGEMLPQTTLTQVRRRDTNISKLKAKLEQLGIEYDLTPFEDGHDEHVAAAEAERKRVGEEAAAAKERAKKAAEAAEAAKAAAPAPAPKRAVAKQPAKAAKPSPAEVVAEAAKVAEAVVEEVPAKGAKARKAGKAAKAAKAEVAEKEAAEAPVATDSVESAKKKKKRKAAEAEQSEAAQGAPADGDDGAAGAEAGQKTPARKKKKSKGA